MLLSLHKKIALCVLGFGLALSLTATPAHAGASPIACSIYVNPTQVTFPGTLDYCEYTPTYCVAGTLCCGFNGVTKISQDKFNEYRRDFIMDSFYTNTVEPDFKSVADEMGNAVRMRISAWGAMIDASIMNDTLKDLGVVTSQSLQGYTPSEQICRIGTLSRGLASSESKMDADRIVLSDGGLNKNLGRAYSISASGLGLEFESRLREFVEKFCSLKDNNDAMDGLCHIASPVVDWKHNRDIDYTRLLGYGTTINADLTDTNGTWDESNLFAMGHYLYGHRQPTRRISYAELSSAGNSEELYAEYRSVAARRAAAQNTYNTLTAMKMAGSGGSEAYIKDVLQYIGISGTTADVFLGAKTNPTDAAVKSSYNQQMNLLTKQIYQDPTFYANLMDSKANVKRTSAALQGIGLMQGRDTYRSMTRSEMLMAILVEMEAREIANNVQGTKGQ